MTSDQLTAILAARILGWRVGPERFIMDSRQWITRAHFQPFDRVQDAFRLLQKAASGFSLTKTPDGVFSATVCVGDRTGTASGSAVAATITRYVQATADELLRLQTALEELIKAKSVVDKVAASVGWPVGGVR